MRKVIVLGLTLVLVQIPLLAFTFSRASNSAKNAATHLIVPAGVVENLPTLLETHGEILRFDSTSLREDDAFTLSTQR